MSKAKSSEKPHYELFYIISNKFTEEELKPISEKIKNVIADNDGEITYQEEWGKKKLAYPIKRSSFGFYFLVEFNSEPEKVEKINHTLRMSGDILRFQIVNKAIRSEAEIKAEKKRADAKVKEEIIIKSEADETEKSKDQQKEKSKVDLKDLDAKLDKILETDDLL